MRRAADLGHPAIAITDCNSVAGLVRAHVEAKKLGQRILVGAELQLADGQCLVALPTDREAYGRLTRLITVGRRRAEKGSCELHMEDVEAHGQGTLFMYLPPEQPDAALAEQLARIALRFPGNFYLAANHLYRGDDARRIETLAGIAEAARVPLVATNDVHHARARAPRPCRRPHLHPREMHDRPGRLARPEKCRAASEERRGDASPVLRARGGARPHGRDRRPDRLHPRRARLRISRRGLERPRPAGGARPARRAHVRDALSRRRARRHSGRARPRARPDRGACATRPISSPCTTSCASPASSDILCQGRGSAANSAVCYCSASPRVDPDRIDLLFERFVSAARNEPPDIDVDFEHERREEVIQ